MMRAAHTGRRLPPLSYRNSVDRIFGVVTEPTENVAWLDAISGRLAIATAEMKAEQEQAERAEMAEFADNYGLGVGQ